MRGIIPILRLPEDRLGKLLRITYNYLIPVACLISCGLLIGRTPFYVPLLFGLSGTVPLIIRVET